VEALRYVPNFNARRVFMHRAEEIGLLIPSSRNLGMPIFEDRHLAKLVSGIEAGLEESNYRLLLIFNDERFVERREYLSLIQSQHVDGLIVWGAQSTEEYWREPVAAGLPLVFACTIPGEADAFNHVVNATRQGVEQVLSLLYRNGHRHIVFMPERKLVNWREWKEERFLSLEMQQAVREFRAAHRDLNLEMSPFYFDVAEKLPPELFGRPDSPTAIATYNYNMAEEAYRHLTAIGVRVPEEVELISCYGFVSSRNWISSIEVDDFEMGRRAAGGLLELSGLDEAVLTGGGIQHQQCFTTAAGGFPLQHTVYFGQLLHQVFLGVQAARRIHNDHVRTLRLCRGYRVENDRRGVASLLVLDDADLRPIRPDGKLFAGRRPESIRRRHGYALSLFQKIMG